MLYLCNCLVLCPLQVEEPATPARGEGRIKAAGVPAAVSNEAEVGAAYEELLPGLASWPGILAWHEAEGRAGVDRKSS